MAHYLIAGYGGIAQALVNQLQQRHRVTVLSRRVIGNCECISWSELDAWLADTMPDFIINTAGLLHDERHSPEKNVQQLDRDWFAQSIDANVWPTVQLAQSLSKRLKPSVATTMLILSARVSSISDNRLGGWYSYRMSKAALNMLIKNLSIEWRRQSPQSCIIGYHPGTVDTPLSKPFQANVPSEQLFATEEAADYLLDCLQQRSRDDSGKLFDWRGDVMPF